MGEAPARSSLVPRDLTAELCLIALASLGILLLGIRLTAFWVVVVGQRFVLCLLLLCLV